MTDTVWPGPGDLAPAFNLPGVQAGGRAQQISSDALRGKPYFLYFYPKAATPGCTAQACAVRDAAPEVRGVSVFGVSPDPKEKLFRFIEKQELDFTLLSDETHELAEAYGVWVPKKLYGRTYMGIERSTFLVDGAGVIRRMKRGIRPADQAAWMDEALVALGR